MNKHILLLAWLITVLACNNAEFRYDPSKLYPELQKGDYWIDKFDQRGLRNSKIVSDKLFCNTTNRYKGQDYLYCFNLKDGKVAWKLPIKTAASQAVEVYENEIYFSSYKGDLKKASMDGTLIWEKEFSSSYSAHKVNPINGNLMVKSVTNGVYELDRETGEQVYHYLFGNGGGLTNPLFYENQIIFGNAAIEAKIGFVGMDYASKKVLWTCNVNEKVQGNEKMGFLKIDKYAFAQDFKGKLYCIDIENGKKLWTKKMTDDNKWVLRFKKESDKLLYYKGKAIALDLATGAEVAYQENLVPLEYVITKESKNYKIMIYDKLEKKELEINIKRM